MISQAIGKDKILYTYDKNGNQLTMTDVTGITARTYDELNRVLTKSVPNLGTSVYRYDIVFDDPSYEGFVGESSKDPKGNETIKIYDRLGRLKLLSGEGQNGRFTSYEYDGNGNRTSIRYPDGSTEIYTYYKNNLLSTLLNKKSGGTVLESYSYKYDAANNQISKTDAKGTTTYTYDSLNRLKTVKEPGGKSTEYVFDKAGNRTREIVTLDGKTTSTLYTYNEQNRLLSTLVEVNGERRITDYTYDNNGNMTSRIEECYKKIDPANPPTPHFGMFIPGQAEGGVTEHAKDLVDSIFYYSYDKFNNMVKASPVGAAACEYKYNGDGLRVEKNVNGKTTRYLYEYDKIVLELDEKGRQTARNVHGINPVSRTSDGATAYYMYNGHADVTALIDESGTILGTYYYDAFGNIEETTGTVDNPFAYAGYQYDKETGLYYLNSRMYDPKIARFMQEDSYRGDYNDPLSLNLYSYCHNEPIMYWDPTGHMRVNERDLDKETGSSASSNKGSGSSTGNKSSGGTVKTSPKPSVSRSNNLKMEPETPAPMPVKSTGQVNEKLSNENTLISVMNKVDEIISLPTNFMSAFIDGESEYITNMVTPFINGDILKDGYQAGEYVSDTIFDSLSNKEDPIEKFKKDGINTAKRIVDNSIMEFNKDVINGDYESVAKYTARRIVDIDLAILSNKYSNTTGNFYDDISKNISSESISNNKRVPIPGDADFVGPIQGGSWKLSPRGQGEHLIERVNVQGRTGLAQFDIASTPRYYPYGTPENAGQAHIRLHEAARGAGIELQGGNPGMSDIDLLNAYRQAYSNSALEGILGDLRTPDGSVVIGKNLTPAQALEELLKWGNK